MLNIPSHERTSAKRTVDDAQVKRFIRSDRVRFKARPRKTFEEEGGAVTEFCDSSPSFRCLPDHVAVSEDEIEEEDPFGILVI